MEASSLTPSFERWVFAKLGGWTPWFFSSKGGRSFRSFSRWRGGRTQAGSDDAAARFFLNARSKGGAKDDAACPCETRRSNGRAKHAPSQSAPRKTPLQRARKARSLPVGAWKDAASNGRAKHAPSQSAPGKTPLPTGAQSTLPPSRRLERRRFQRARKARPLPVGAWKDAAPTGAQSTLPPSRRLERRRSNGRAKHAPSQSAPRKTPLQRARKARSLPVGAWKDAAPRLSQSATQKVAARLEGRHP